MTKATCVPCISSEARGVLLEEFHDPALSLLLESVPECKHGEVLRLCPAGAKGQRPRTEYQQFISTCMKAKSIKGFGNAAPAMKQCAVEWKQRP